MRATISIGSNIAEGNRRSRKEFRRFIDISLGSCEEVVYQLSLYKMIYSKDDSDIIALTNKIIGQLVNLKKSLNPKPDTLTSL
jgi:four helix bundle protein